MSPRKASLRVAHERYCPNRTKSALSSTGRGSGCKCEPSFFAFRRNREGKPEPGPRYKSRKVAEAEVNRWQVEIDEGRAGVKRSGRMTFNQWADEYEQKLERRVRDKELKPKTPVAYRETLTLARLEFGETPLADIGPSELDGFYGRVEAPSAAGKLRHLRQLSACMASAVDYEKLDRNPLSSFIKKKKLKVPKRGKAPFEDDELSRLWVAYKQYEPVYGASARFSTETGMRLGELVALDWPNVNLTDGRVYVEWTWDQDAGELVAPKDGESRWVYLTPEAKEVLEAWVVVVGARDNGPVFPNPVGGGRLIHRQAQRRLSQAMSDAGVVKIHPDLRLPRSWHSFRYTTSNLLQRRGYHPRFIEQTLGHSTLELSFGVYGAWSPEQLQAEAAAHAPDEAE